MSEDKTRNRRAAGANLADLTEASAFHSSLIDAWVQVPAQIEAAPDRALPEVEVARSVELKLQHQGLDDALPRMRLVSAQEIAPDDEFVHQLGRRLYAAFALRARRRGDHKAFEITFLVRLDTPSRRIVVCYVEPLTPPPPPEGLTVANDTDPLSPCLAWPADVAVGRRAPPYRRWETTGAESVEARLDFVLARLEGAHRCEMRGRISARYGGPSRATVLHLGLTLLRRALLALARRRRGMVALALLGLLELARARRERLQGATRAASQAAYVGEAFEDRGQTLSSSLACGGVQSLEILGDETGVAVRGATRRRGSVGLALRLSFAFVVFGMSSNVEEVATRRAPAATRGVELPSLRVPGLSPPGLVSRRDGEGKASR